MRTRVKICGITRMEDALAAVRSGADALGFVFVPASPRALQVDAARRISARLPAFVTRVGLFLDAPPDDVARALDAMPDLVPQFHGTETAADCERHGRPYLKALALGGGAAGAGAPDTVAGGFAGAPAAYESATGFLVDSHAPGALGGTGVALDWTALGPTIETLGGRALVLAGGLSPDNVARAVRTVRPWAVDVSSGVESGKGIKDHDAMRAFLRAVRDADEAHGADEALQASRHDGRAREPREHTTHQSERGT